MAKIPITEKTYRFQPKELEPTIPPPFVLNRDVQSVANSPSLYPENALSRPDYHSSIPVSKTSELIPVKVPSSQELSKSKDRAQERQQTSRKHEKTTQVSQWFSQFFYSVAVMTATSATALVWIKTFHNTGLINVDNSTTNSSTNTNQNTDYLIEPMDILYQTGFCSLGIGVMFDVVARASATEKNMCHDTLIYLGNACFAVAVALFLFHWGKGDNIDKLPQTHSEAFTAMFAAGYGLFTLESSITLTKRCKSKKNSVKNLVHTVGVTSGLIYSSIAFFKTKFPDALDDPKEIAYAIGAIVASISIAMYTKQFFELFRNMPCNNSARIHPEFVNTQEAVAVTMKSNNTAQIDKDNSSIEIMRPSPNPRGMGLI